MENIEISPNTEIFPRLLTKIEIKTKKILFVAHRTIYLAVYHLNLFPKKTFLVYWA